MQKVYFEPFPKQQQFIEAVFNPKYLICGYGGAKGGGKLLPLHMLIPTPSGWTTIGELQCGDYVIDANGNPTEVIGVSDVNNKPSAWELTFDDGQKIICDEGHQWLTLTHKERRRIERSSEQYRSNRKAKRVKRGNGKRPDLALRNSQNAVLRRDVPYFRGSVKTTKEIVESIYYRKFINHSVVNCHPINLPDAPLPLKPYTLGAWLGDGSSASGVLTGIDKEIWENIEADGYQVRHLKNPQSHSIAHISDKLRKLGVLNNKHIPQAYLRASISQRLALLQGLCDTDGYCCKDKGSVEFTTTSEKLRDGFMELVYSLGIKASCRQGIAKLYGRDIGKKWRIQFWFDKPCFRIKRKLERQKFNKGVRRNQRYIIKAVRVKSEPMKCIAVASRTRTYLCGEAMIPTHNTAVCLSTLILLHRLYPQSVSIVTRDSVPRLNDTTIPSFDKVCPPNFIENFTRHPGTVYFKNGSKMMFRAEDIDHDRDLDKFKGLEVNFAFIEQLDEHSENIISAIIPAVGRNKVPSNPPSKLLYSLNPTNNWARSYTYERWKRGTLEENHFYLPATIFDNPILAKDETYMSNLRNMDSLTYDRHINGNWDAFKGKNPFAYAFNETRHTAEVLQTEITQPYYISFDFNHSPMTCTIWQHWENHIRCIYELETNFGLIDLCRKIKDWVGFDNELKRICFITGDRSGWSKSPLVEGSRTAYDIIQHELNITAYQIKAPQANPSILKSRELTNSILEKHGDFLISRTHCQKTIYDLKFVEVDEEHDIVKDRHKQEGKADYLDTLRYYLNTFHQEFIRI